MRILERHPWPENVRELRHALDYAVIHCRGQVIHPRDLPPEVAARPSAADLKVSRATL
jgi:DNA-binding NtrC family response regulator